MVKITTAMTPGGHRTEAERLPQPEEPASTPPLFAMAPSGSLSHARDRAPEPQNPKHGGRGRPVATVTFGELNTFPLGVGRTMKQKISQRSVQFSSAAQSCPTLCDPVNRSPPGLPVHRQLPESTQTCPSSWDAIQPSHPLSSPSPPAPNPSQHQGLSQWVNSSHEVAKVL